MQLRMPFTAAVFAPSRARAQPIAVLEEIADQPPGARGDNDRVRLGQGLQTGSEVRRFADDRLFLRRSLTDQIADASLAGRCLL
jgi:hypothetical protein